MVHIMNDIKPVIVGFPLNGEWVTPRTPGDKIPSHGTDALGQRFAFDFFRTKIQTNTKFYNCSTLQYYTIGISINDCYCYKENIYSPVDGVVIVARNGIKEPKRLHPIKDLLRVLWNSITVSMQSIFLPVEKINLHKYIGNYIIIKFDEFYAFFAHISQGTIIVNEGQSVRKGDLIGKVGHTGNSTAPHLHFHIMDSADLLTAKGISCKFEEYDVLIDDSWIKVEKEIPKSFQRIRHI